MDLLCGWRGWRAQDLKIGVDVSEDIKSWLGAAALIISLLTSVYAWLTSGAKANTKRLDSIDNQLTEHDRRIQATESELKHLPDKDDVNDLKLAISELRGTVGRLDENMSGISRTVRRVEGYLTKEGN